MNKVRAMNISINNNSFEDYFLKNIGTGLLSNKMEKTFSGQVRGELRQTFNL